MQVYLNGRMVPRGEARLDPADAGFQHGVGLFETMAAYHGRVFRLDRHLGRLARSAAELGLARELDTAGLADAVGRCLEANGLERARVRLTVTPGPVDRPGPGAAADGSNGSDGSDGSNGSDSLAPGHSPSAMTVLVVAEPPTEYDPAYFERGIRVVVGSQAANPFDPNAGHKTLNYWARLRTLRRAASVGAGEAIWLSVTNHLAGGAVSNVFLVRGGELLTPIAHGEEVEGALPAPVLPGITRAAVLELAEARGIPVARRMLSVTDLLDADEVFLTNASWHVLPVTGVEKKTIGEATVGPTTRALREALLETIERETGESGP